MRKCDVCNRTDQDEDEDDVLLYGEWMTKQNVTVHYYCLLLSTNLPQRGGDSSGILGFLLRDIRVEIAAAQKRKCAFCKTPGASVACHKCRIVFHVACGLDNRCVSQFCDEFHSYCENCAPHDDYQLQLLENPPKNTECSICFRFITVFTLTKVTYGDCCRQGFAHRKCMRRYAIASGYYLRCLWCRDKKFHDTIKLQSVFVPDRDASWERQPNAYVDLHHKRSRCDQEVCICPNGRDYNRGTWCIHPCILCAATGAHLKCRVGTLRMPRSMPDFKCNFCTDVERKLDNRKKQGSNDNENRANEAIDTSFFLTKKPGDLSVAADQESPTQSDEDNGFTFSDRASIVTVISSQPTPQAAVETTPPNDSPTQSTSISVIELPDTQPLNILKTLKPPLLLRESFDCEEYFYLVVYEFQDQQPEPIIGTCTLRFPLSDERIQDKSEQSLEMLELTETDVWIRDSNRGIYDKVDQYTNHFS